MYYDLSKVLSYSALLNILIGERGTGKTYSVSKFAISQFIKKQEQFVYVRRYKNELKRGVTSFFSAISKNNEFPNHEFTTKRKQYVYRQRARGLWRYSFNCSRP